MRAGRLRHRVLLQRRVESQGATGEVTWSWADVAEVWGEVRPVTVRDRVLAGNQLAPEVTTVIRIRRRPGVHAKLRALYVAEPGSPGLVHTYDVIDVINYNERDRELQLSCRRSDSEGFAYDGNT